MGLIAGLLLCAATAFGAQQFQPGFIFSDTAGDPNNTVTSNRLWQFVALSVVQTNFVIDRTFYGYPSNNDQVLYFQTSSNALFKTSISNLVNGMNIFSVTFTNLAQQTAPGAQDAFHVFASNVGSNRLMTVSNLLTGATLANNNTNGDVFLFWDSTNTVPKKTTLSLIRDFVTNNSPTLLLTNFSGTNSYVKYVITNAMPAAAGAFTNAHGLPGIPQLVKVSLVCTNVDSTMHSILGEEYLATSFYAGSGPAFHVAVNSNNIYCRAANSPLGSQIIDTGVQTTVNNRNNFIIKTELIFYR